MYFILSPSLSLSLSLSLSRSTVTLATYFETLYPGSILHVRLCQDLQYLDALVAKRSKVVMKLERAIAILKKTGLIKWFSIKILYDESIIWSSLIIIIYYDYDY